MECSSAYFSPHTYKLATLGQSRLPPTALSHESRRSRPHHRREHSVPHSLTLVGRGGGGHSLRSKMNQLQQRSQRDQAPLQPPEKKEKKRRGQEEQQQQQQQQQQQHTGIYIYTYLCVYQSPPIAWTRSRQAMTPVRGQSQQSSRCSVPAEKRTPRHPSAAYRPHFF